MLELVAMTPGLLPPHSTMGFPFGTVTWKVGQVRTFAGDVKGSQRNTPVPAASDGSTWGDLHCLRCRRESR